MVQRKVEFAPYEFYHVYNRGVDKRVLFQSQADYQRFQSLLYLANTTESINVRNISRQSLDTLYKYDKVDSLVAIGAYCLMPNHFHILLTPIADDGVTQFMRKLCTSYSMYFNAKYQRSGTLFEGRFKSQWADEDRYLQYLYSYIHLNPLKLQYQDEASANQVSQLQYLCEYPFSSLADYVGVYRPQQTIIDPSQFPDYFQTSAGHISELHEWLSYKSDQTEELKDYW